MFDSSAKLLSRADFAIPTTRDGSLTGGVSTSAASAADLGRRPRTLLAERANSQPSLGAQTLQRPASRDRSSSLDWLGPQVAYFPEASRAPDCNDN